jgi:membrane-associated phospholipid phosphatase
MPGFRAQGWLVLLFLALSAPGALHAEVAARETYSPAGEAPARKAAPPGLFRLTWADAALAAGGAGLQVWAHLRFQGMEPVDPGAPDADDLNPLDRWAAGRYHEPSARISDLLIIPLIGAPLAVSAWGAHREELDWHSVLVESVILAEALALSSSLNLLVRSLRIHPRPLAYPDSDAPESEKRKGEASGSFYSGHANAAFLAAVHLAYVHSLRHPDSDDAVWLWAGGLGAATTVAGLRVAAGKHFPSDILAGAAMGAFFGWLFPRLHLAGPAPGRTKVSLLPAEGGARLHMAHSF